MLIKQKEIAEKANISAQMLSNILNGRRRPSWKTAKALASATSTEPKDWMEENPEKIKQIIIENMPN